MQLRLHNVDTAVVDVPIRFTHILIKRAEVPNSRTRIMSNDVQQQVSELAEVQPDVQVPARYALSQLNRQF